ncbi:MULTISPECIES: pseudaminic acid cytidylyltransferase [Vibrio]|jgi:N-acylneuraminate cytidylyltransferase|uniref:Pseudaminic acid cytidylyltransferase n=1 Tax=Vibrio rotiferianus TaxID=190895 RepID=A0ABX3D5E3_9VIBR|nr:MULTISPECIES: pseudaminic acid cytidylyltransferase [Vibrio]MDK9775068.1 pseudaminic acid cytidylyltransferase [Vibrio sp. D401a]MDK9807734.1 pseudaminic acid cytidylyltransferase [Vibrio sp. D406a]OHY90001.1 pseudaminic acid cytidylyltransferase [Vibrio rotiferianus]PIB18014.1 NeuA [Vibrio rotiferianus CAIM 577 = LMG 21460]USD50177.1 pseudaminic acid cytidylyltransferase [Vibrio sp. SCSIO 43153]
MKVAIIPARGGSKRIPRKNIKEFNGKPIIAYSIEAALESGCFDKVVVSTDDQEIADVALQYGAEVPFIRPEAVSNDYATTADVILHALDWFEEQAISIEYICCIYATAPFIAIEDIQLAYQMLLKDPAANYCFPVCEFPFPIQRGVKLTAGNRVEMFQPEHFNTRSQDLETGYHDIGQFYWGKPKAYRDNIPMFSNTAIALPVSRNRVVDLDTQEDWEFALLLSKALQGS